MDNQLSIGGLIKHCWNLIWTGPFAAGRIGRGEYWVSIMILSLLSSVISYIFLELAANLGSASLYVILVFAVVTTILQIKLIIKRSHDLGKTGWYAYVPLFLLILCFVAAGVVAGGAGLFQAFESQNAQAIMDIMRSGPVALVGIVALVVMIRAVCRGIVIAFFKGNAGDNQYGSDPLVFQPSSNTNYWVVGLLAFVLSMLLSSFTQDTNESMYTDLMNNGTGDTVDQDLNVGEGDEMLPSDSMVMTGDDTSSDTQRVDMTASGIDMDNLPSDTPNMDGSTTEPAIDPMESAGGGV